jgi:hypothetical protein
MSTFDPQRASAPAGTPALDFKFLNFSGDLLSAQLKIGPTKTDAVTAENVREYVEAEKSLEKYRKDFLQAAEKMRNFRKLMPSENEGELELIRMRTFAGRNTG